MNNYYAQAIQVLADSKTDFRALAYEIAKSNPKAVASAAARLSVGFGWQGPCLKLMQANQKVEAIKLCRNMTGMGIMEAKDAVEALI
jgi:ribosomal protein L7/L12